MNKNDPPGLYQVTSLGIQYEVISELYGCKKTIFGDANQAVSPMSAESADRIQEILPESQCMFMHKSYRSTVEINRVAQAIKPNSDIVPSCTERHYASVIDRHMLYVACTRAMHRLDLTTTGGPSSRQNRD